MENGVFVIVLLLNCYFTDFVYVSDFTRPKCGSTIYVNSSNVIRLDSTSITLPHSCKISMENNVSKSEVHLRLLEFYVPCGEGEVTLSGYSSNNGDKSSLCGINIPTRIYKSHFNTLTISYSRKGDNSSISAYFKILATRVSTGHCGSLHYECINGDCVDESVKCDGYNNCDDNSDEDAKCGLDVGFISGVAIAACGSLIFLIYLIVLVYRNIRHGTIPKQEPPRLNLSTIREAVPYTNFHTASGTWCPPPSYFRSPGSVNMEDDQAIVHSQSRQTCNNINLFQLGQFHKTQAD